MNAYKLTLNHTARSYCVTPVETVPELVDRLMQEPHIPLCNAYRLGKFIFLNDADYIEDDSIFVVITPAQGNVKDIFRVVDWFDVPQCCQRREISNQVRRIVGGKSEFHDIHFSNIHLEPPEDHEYCMHCK
jgi:hypothetical protein